MEKATYAYVLCMLLIKVLQYVCKWLVTFNLNVGHFLRTICKLSVGYEHKTLI